MASKVAPEGGIQEFLEYEKEDAKYPALARTSCGFMKRSHPLRKWCIAVMRSRTFDAVIMFFIITNSIVMAMSDYRVKCLGRNDKQGATFGQPDPSRCWQNTFGDFTNRWVFGIVFIIEMVIKMVAMGLFAGENTYFKDAWCWLDFVCVLAYVVGQMGLNVGGLMGIKALRLLRPLKSVNKFPAHKKIVVAYTTSIEPLFVTMVMLCFLLFVISIACMQFFKGAMHYRCALPGFDPEAEDQSDFDTGEICSSNSASNPRTAHSGDEACETGTTCEYFGSNPTYEGFEHFDNIGAASIVILQCASFDAWTEGMCAESSGPFESSPSLIRIPLHAGTCSWTTSSPVRGCIMCSSWLSVASSSSTSSSPSSCRNFSTARRYRGSPNTECVRVSH